MYYLEDPSVWVNSNGQLDAGLVQTRFNEHVEASKPKPVENAAPAEPAALYYGCKDEAAFLKLHPQERCRRIDAAKYAADEARKAEAVKRGDAYALANLPPNFDTLDAEHKLRIANELHEKSKRKVA